MSKLRERRRADVRERLTAAAYELVTERGYDAATVEAIAERAEVGRTTAFRHFPTKEDLFLGWIDDVGTRLDDALRASPRTLPPLTAIRRAMRTLAESYVEFADRTFIVARLSSEVPALRARYLERKRAWEDVLAADVATRLAISDGADWRPRLVAQTVLAAAAAASEQWFLDGGTNDLPAHIDWALAALERGLRTIPRPDIR